MFLVIVSGVVFLKCRCMLYHHQNPCRNVHYKLSKDTYLSFAPCYFCARALSRTTRGALELQGVGCNNSPMSECVKYYCKNMTKGKKLGQRLVWF